MTRSKSSQDGNKSNSNRSKNSRKDKKKRSSSYSSSSSQDHQQDVAADASQSNWTTTTNTTDDRMHHQGGHTVTHPPGYTQASYVSTTDSVDSYSMDVQAGSNPFVDDAQASIQGQRRRERREHAMAHPGVNLTKPPRRNSHSSQINSFNETIRYSTQQRYQPAYPSRIDPRDLEGLVPSRRGSGGYGQ